MFLKANDVKDILNVSQAMGYKVIRQLNSELKEKGFLTLQGRIPIEYLCERFMIDEDEVKKYLDEA